MNDTDTYLSNLGLDLKGARKRRRWTLASVHQHLACSVQTIQRMEKGDPAVGMGRYLSYIHLLGLSLVELDDSEKIRRQIMGHPRKE